MRNYDNFPKHQADFYSFLWFQIDTTVVFNNLPFSRCFLYLFFFSYSFLMEDEIANKLR